MSLEKNEKQQIKLQRKILAYAKTLGMTNSDLNVSIVTMAVGIADEIIEASDAHSSIRTQGFAMPFTSRYGGTINAEFIRVPEEEAKPGEQVD